MELLRYHANVIAEHIYSQLDQDGHGVSLPDEVTDHKFDETAVKGDDGIFDGPTRSKVQRRLP